MILVSFILWLNLQTHADVWPTKNHWTETPPTIFACTNWPATAKAQADCQKFGELVAELRQTKPHADWEDLFAVWVKNFWTTDIFISGDSSLEGIATDCAKASYAMRMYFSFLNNLEFRTASQFSNKLTQFDKIRDPQERFKTFVAQSLQHLSTATLAQDTYPIAINREYFRPGIVYEANPGSHSMQIINIEPSGNLTITQSTVPIEVRFLDELPIPPPYKPEHPKHLDGYRKFKRPEDYGKPESALPGYSIEQFRISHDTFSVSEFNARIKEKLKIPGYQESPESFSRQIKNSLNLICESAQDREKLVQFALEFKGEGCIKDEGFYYDNSTFDRDAALAHHFRSAKALYDKLMAMNPADVSHNELSEFDLAAFMAIFSNDGKYKPTSVDTSFKGCLFSTNFNKSIVDPDRVTLRRIWQAIEQGRLVSDPNASYLQRFGLAPFTQECPRL